ncbi:MAG: 16S rRNA (adenine(1518)-N(6)/adenine(1519)-N(6))-dimethyltransferase RsmA [Candidatus Saccharimonadales bacterium]
MENPKKSLGQHWLKDNSVLIQIAKAGKLTSNDTVLEIGPGLGFLTKHLVEGAGQVVAVELDERLAKGLAHNFRSPKLKVVAADILKFDLGSLPAGYKVVANIPYYLTSHLLRALAEAANPPALIVLLVQKEVAKRVCAKPGQMSLLSVSAQLYYDCQLGLTVKAELFEPPPKVDSQLLILTRRPKPLFEKLDSKLFFQIVKAGFSARRKKLRSSLAGGLNIKKAQADEILAKAEVNGDLRAEALSFSQWYKLYIEFAVQKDLRSLL